METQVLKGVDVEGHFLSHEPPHVEDDSARDAEVKRSAWRGEGRGRSPEGFVRGHCVSNKSKW